ncbi:DUF4352 domain-containing protein [Clostridium fallax]|uniref:DUF4352 domain-containing protein n=1 Tax=Clostridium fallax TaxID=1533 RepID=A0A1M4YKA7_9CLOT|nr:DUF4352 domain-containing protein [Clostridium fallax]SHF05932.1 protein of unknown function [Clostridium fallax]SQB06296.1 Telomeric repeat-binding factor 2 [Clostridium fallax]
MSKKLKKIVSLLAIVTVLGIAGIGCGESKEQVQNNNEGTKTEEKQDANSNTEKVFKIGDSITIDNMVLTITDFQETAGDSNNVPKDGNKFVVVYLNLENKGKENIKYDPLNFKIKCTDGTLIGESLSTLDGVEALKAGELSPGSSVSGTIAYEVPKSDTGLNLIFQDPDFANNAKITIDLKK